MPRVDFYEQHAELLSTPVLVRHTVGSRGLGANHRAFFSNHQCGPGTLLDIGCGDAHFIESAQKRGWQVAGLDLDSRALDIAKRRGLDELHCTPLEAFAPSSRFQWITFFEVLEHQPDPLRFMEHVKHLLTPGGIVAGSVPNRQRFRLSAFENSDRPPYHFTRWSEASLHGFLSRLGFNRIKVENVGYGYYLPAWLGRLIYRTKKLAVRDLSAADCELCSLEESATHFGMGNGGRALLRAVKRAKVEVLRPFEYAESVVERRLNKGRFLYFEARWTGQKQEAS